MSAALINHPPHGGQLNVYAKHYGIARSHWLDLSTGINPQGYPLPDLSQAVLRDLPNDDDGLQQAACAYYQCDEVLMVPGSSWAIQTLPLVLCQQYPFIKQVLLPKKGYSEHKRAWQTQGVSIVQYHDLPSEEQLQACDVCVLINPNNPSTQLCSVQTVLNIAKQLQHNSGMLIVDEAFIDTQPQCSVLAYRGENTIVLRSLGKFFGLAGLRVGSIMANETILQSCQSLLPPWALSHPARYISQQALQDGPWINKTIMHLQQQAEKLAALCKHNLEHAAFECAVLHTDLFVSLFFDSKTSALDYHHRLCQQGIYTRLLDDQCGIRIGLPENTQAHWQRLEHGLLQAALAFKKDITYA